MQDSYNVAYNREKLKAAYYIKQQINEILDTIIDLESEGILSGIKYGDKVSGSKSSTPEAEIIAEHKENLIKLEQDFIIEAELVRRDIEKLELTDREKKILTLKYVDCYMWKEIAPRICKTERHVRRLEENIMKKIYL